MPRTLTLLLLLAALTAGVAAQSSNLEPKTSSPPPPVVSFEFELPGATPPHYSIAVEPDGKAAYRADEAPVAGTAPGQPYTTKFVLSGTTRQRIFDLTLALDCFKGNYEFRPGRFGGGRVANMGAKTLKCTYADRASQTTYNYTANPKLQQLTTLFQDLSNTLEFGRRLAYLRRFDKLGLEGEMKSLEEQEKNQQLAELQLLAPQLEAIFNDTGVMNLTRRRAEHMLQVIKADPAARAAAPE